MNESTAYPVRFNLISALLLQITGECSTPSLTYRFGGITDFFTRQVVGNEWNEVAAVVIMFFAAMAGYFVGAALQEEMGGAILFAVIAGFACVIYNMDNRE